MLTTIQADAETEIIDVLDQETALDDATRGEVTTSLLNRIMPLLREDNTTDSPAIPARVRSTVYLIALGVSALVLLVTGLVAIYVPGEAERTLAAGGVITSVVGLVTGGLGVAYRPTR